MSGGHAYGEAEPTEACPYCSTTCRADFVDVGVGYTQCGPYHCEACGASEIGPHDDERKLAPDETRTGWYAPGAELGSSANVINGRVVSHREMQKAYRQEFTGNPLHAVPGHVDAWRANLRRRSL